MKRHLGVIGRREGDQAIRTNGSGAPRSHLSRLSRRMAPRTGTDQPALRLKEISVQGTQKGTVRVTNILRSPIARV
jgi:hypothetical protein